MEKKMSIDIEQLKQIVSTEVDRLQDRLITIAKALYDDPEISFEEHRSMALLAGIAEEAGFEVERQVGGLVTAYKAVYRTRCWLFGRV
jgi:metal-dependent amidase/aminoacylase/carboxypeptidase family protein